MKTKLPFVVLNSAGMLNKDACLQLNFRRMLPPLIVGIIPYVASLVQVGSLFPFLLGTGVAGTSPTSQSGSPESWTTLPLSLS